jgi:hypothetical protein
MWSMPSQVLQCPPPATYISVDCFLAGTRSTGAGLISMTRVDDRGRGNSSGLGIFPQLAGRAGKTSFNISNAHKTRSCTGKLERGDDGAAPYIIILVRRDVCGGLHEAIRA